MRFIAEKTRLILWLGVILALGFLTTSVIGFLASRNSVRANIIEQGLPQTGDNVYSEIQKDILRPIAISAQMAQNTFMRDWLLSGERDPSQVVRYLANIKQKFNANTSFLISERTRKYYYGAGILKTISQTNPLDAWYFRVREMKHPYETNADPDKANRDTMTIFINYRVLDYAGQYIGVTGVGITLSTMRGVIQNIEKRFHRRVYFTDQQGQITLANATEQNWRGSIRDLPGLSSIAGQILGGATEPVQLMYTTNGDTIQVNSRFIPELRWHLIVEQNEAEAIRPFTRLLGINLSISAATTLLVLGLTFLTVNRYQGRLEHAAMTDSLTGTANRQMGETLLVQAFKDVRRTRQTLSVVLFDIDHFKRINDRHGHPVGDEVIRSVARLARGGVREGDVVARWGGEEFLVLLKGCTLEAALEIAEKIRKTIAQHDFVTASEPVTVSLGVAERTPDEPWEACIARSDRALYAAKDAGRNRVQAATA
jgi:diguanylate cyclase (GGDEF)-like protein